MTFESALQTAITLANEYTALGSTISGMAVAADHDPSWGDRDEEKLNAHYARRSELDAQLAVAFNRLARDHREAWYGFLVASTARLAALARRDEQGRIAAEYEHDRWAPWSRGMQPPDAPEIFARGIATLDEHRDTIDRLIRGR